MKVNENVLSQAAASQLGKTRGAAATETGGAREGSAAQGQDGDQVSLSNLSSKLFDMLADPADRQARIDRLAADYRAGRYQPDALAASQGIVDEAMRV